uniref:Uncharacterized protein n=1 Tax=Timema poppense TaxID=170557 RepID=A0A7R9DTR9_TIMPO|nr:unnamed protein product [Timema poppensis]
MCIIHRTCYCAREYGISIDTNIPQPLSHHRGGIYFFIALSFVFQSVRHGAACRSVWTQPGLLYTGRLQQERGSEQRGEGRVW